MVEVEETTAVEYLILARYVSKLRRHLQWYKPANSEVPLVAIASWARRLSRKNTKMRVYKLYKLDGELKLGIRQDSGPETLEHPKTIQFTKKQIVLVREGTENTGSHWLQPLSVELELVAWETADSKK